MYFKQIDSFRFFAVLMVLISHWLVSVPHVEQLRFGAFGVEFFFVISGFLISLQLYEYKDKVEAKMATVQNALYVFYWRRILRIFPLYYFVLLLATAFNKGEIRDAFFWNLGYMSNFYIIKVQHWTSIFSHFWSLSVEEHFYVFWPLMILLVRKKYFWLLFLITTIFSVCFRYLVFYDPRDYFKVYIHTLSCLDLFMLGAVLAYLFKYKASFFGRLFHSQWVAMLTITMAAILYSIWLFQSDWAVFNWVFQRLLFGLIYFFTLGILVVGIKGKFGTLLENNKLVKLGKLSYGIYLVHNFIPGALLPIKKLGLNIMIEFLVYFIVTILVSELLYRIVEKPMRNLNRNFKLKLGPTSLAKDAALQV